MKEWHILLADDDKDDRFFFQRALRELSFPTSLSTVSDGEKLLSYLEKPTQGLPDVIFLDLNMPRKNGGECLTLIKSHKDFQKIPVIIYSTSLHEEVADVLYKNGAHYYLQKTSFQELPSAINRILTALAKNPQKPLRDDFIVKSPVIK